MAPKRAPPLIDPPPASSSEEDEEISSGEEEETSCGEEEEASSSSSSSSEEEEHPPQNPTTTINSEPESSSTEFGFGSEESDSDTEPKPIASKSGEQTPKVKEPSSKPLANSSTAKRPRENGQQVKDSKRAKRIAGTPSTDNASNKYEGDSWRRLQIAHWELHLKRLELLMDQTKSILEAYKSSTK